ncbi:hypothetical protein BaRGS_00021062 [Batillaria attramentaria]|uniref:Uncharacterized protein n=1 Tax=Batillaria attramentaria TaxID=370345 RepID=A0ABD0KKA9_9CAEN
MDSPASRPHETQGQSFVNPYHQPLMDSPASKPQGYRDFKNPEDVQIEKFMINLLNDAMRSKHVVSRDISGDAMQRAEGAEASLSENNDVITLGKETERRGVEEENPSIPSLYNEVDPKQIDFGTTANMEDMRVSGKATPEMLASMSTPSDALT